MCNKEQFTPGQVIKVLSLWTLISPVAIWHYGVVVGHDDVVHFNLDTDLQSVSIIRTNLERFQGHGLYLQVCQVSESHKKYDDNEIIIRALNEVGGNFGGYDLINNNCEHFANWCVTGNKFSNQVFFKNEDGHSVPEKLFDKYVAEPTYKEIDMLSDKVDQTLNEWEEKINNTLDFLDPILELFR